MTTHPLPSEPDTVIIANQVATWDVAADPPGPSADVACVELYQDGITVALHTSELSRAEAERLAGALIAATSYQWSGQATQEIAALPPERHSPGQTGHGEGQDTSDDPIAVLRRLQAAGLGHLAEQLGVRLTNPTGPPQPWDITSYEHDPHGGPDIAIFADGHRMPIKPRPTGIEALKACGVTVAEAIQNLGYAPDAAERIAALPDISTAGGYGIPAAEEAGS